MMKIDLPLKVWKRLSSLSTAMLRHQFYGMKFGYLLAKYRKKQIYKDYGYKYVFGKVCK